MSLTREQRETLRYSYAIIVTLVGSGLLLVAWVIAGNMIQSRARSTLDQFHLSALMRTQDLTARIAALKEHLDGTDGGAMPAPGTARERTIDVNLYLVGRGLDALEAQQLASGQERFAGSVARARTRYEQFREDVARGASVSHLAGQLDALGLTIQQLDRLHSIAAEEALTTLSLQSAGGVRVLLIGAGVVLLVSGLLVFRQLKLLRERLRQHTRTREKLVENEKMLQQQQKMEALGTLVGGVAHDFNNLLTVILGQTEKLIAERAHDEAQRSALVEIQKAGERAAALTRQLLSFSRHEMVDPVVLDMSMVIRDLEPLLRRVIPANVSLSVALDEGPSQARVDPVQIEQVILNLAVNAKDAMPDGGALSILCSRLRMEDGDAMPPGASRGSYVRIRVADTGEGMSPETRARAFEPFFTTKPQGKGTGLGLSTVHGIVTTSGGFIMVESDAGKGTMIDVYLPSAAGPATEDRPRETMKTPGGPETILVVEDEEQVRGFACTGLRDSDYRVLEAASGLEAIRLCLQHDGPIDLILTDVIMPGMGGPEFVDQAHRYLPDAGVVFMSGYTDDDILHGVRASGRPFLPKPFKLRELLQVVRAELDARNAGRRDRTA